MIVWQERVGIWSGSTFGRLTVIEKDEVLTKEKHRTYWICSCSCGNTISVRADSLSKTIGCGCAKTEHPICVGDKFGKLVVTKFFGVNSHREYTWHCQCECGNTCIVTNGNLKSGNTQSCGCLKSKHHENYMDNNRRCDRAYKNWAKQIKVNADYTCNICGKHGGNLNSHHLNDWHTHEDLRYDINNGVCLCETCHKAFHSWMGGNDKATTEQDYIDFKRIKQST